jgi:PAS domain S-box-containing protein
MALTGLEGGTLCLVNPDRQSLELAAQINTSPETIRDLTTNVIRIGDCLCGECARTCQPLLLWDNASGSEFATREATRNEGIRFHAAFPLLVQDRCIGVLCVFARNEARPSERSLQLVQDLCGPIALAIENARLFKSVQQELAERRRAEGALRESERKVSEALEFNRKILNTSSIAIMTFRESGPCTFANEAAAKMGGTNVASILAQNFHQVESWKEFGMYEAALEALRTGAEQYLETHHTTTWGRDVWFNLQFCCFHCGGEKQLLVFTQDVTERKRAEEALRASEERFKVIATNTPDHLLVQDADLRYLWVVNPQLGLTEEDMIGKTDFDLLGTEDAEKLTQIKREVLASGQPVHVEVPLVSLDGNTEYFDGSYIPKHDPDGRVDGLIGYFRNVTERKRAEEALRESEEELRAILDATPFPIALVDVQDNQIDFWSRSALALFGHTAPTAPQWYQIAYPDPEYRSEVIDRWKPSLEKARRSAQAVNTGEYRVTCHDGSVRICELYAAFLADRLIVTFNDITERKRAEEALRRLNERLELQVAQRTAALRHTVGQLQQLTLEISQAEDRERRRIADLLHDDVQQILAAAKFHLNLLSSEARSPEESQEIVEQVKQMLKEAIEKSRSLSHELSPVLYQVDLTEILNWLARHMQRRHGLIVHVEAHGPVDSSSEPLKAFLYRVAQELLFNVVKHAEVNEARICVRRLGRCICLSVTDQGRGFDPQRLEEAGGFGLRTIRERVQLLGGRMKIKSMRGVGSRLLIAVPDEGLPQVAAPTESRDGWVQAERRQRDKPDGLHS